MLMPCPPHASLRSIIMSSNEKNQATLQRFLTYLKADKGYSPLTLTAYEGDLTDFAKFIDSTEENLTWQDIDADLIRRWVVASREEKISPRSIKRRLSSVRSFYKYLLMMGEVDKNPARLVKNPKEDKPLPYFLRQEEIDQLLDHTKFPDTFEGMRDRLIILTFYSTGIRRAELIGLNIEDVALSAGEIKVTGKRNKQRIIPFGQELKEAFAAYITARTAHLKQSVCTKIAMNRAFFISKSGLRISEADVYKVVSGYLSLVTLQKHRSPHILRHTFATTMLNNGADLRAVQELLGHESLKTTEIYTHTTFAELKEIYAKAHPRSRSKEDIEE